MNIIREYKLKPSIGGSIVVLRRVHETTPFIVTVKKDGILAVEQDSANGIYCTSIVAAASIIKRVR